MQLVITARVRGTVSESLLVHIFILNSAYLIKAADERIYDYRRKLFASLGYDLSLGVLSFPGFLVGALAGKGIIYIGNCNYLGIDRDFILRQSSGIAVSIPSFVVLMSDLSCHGNDFA